MTTAEKAMQAGRSPLYAQVYDILVQRISSGPWRPGQLLPNEFDLARELGVSQGTVRKALDRLAAEHLVVRRQGRGTFVAEHTADAVHFRYFHLHGPDGDRATPDSIGIRVSRGKAAATDRAKLELPAGAEVVRIDRVRTVEGEPMIVERIVLPGARFPDIESIDPIPNTLYDLFQSRYGITVAGADEQLTAGSATPAEAVKLKVAPGTPLLVIDRIAFGVDGTRVEWRLSRCLTDKLRYLSRLR